LTEQQKSMRSNYRRPLLNVEAFALVVLGFVLYPALTHFSFPFFRRAAHPGKIPLYDSRLQRQVPVCKDTWLLIFFDNANPHAGGVNKAWSNPYIIPRRTEVSHEIVPTLDLHRLGSCGDVRLPARKGEGYVNYVSRDPGFVLPAQPPAYRGTTRPQMLTGRIPETTIGRDLKAMNSE
jgi:hypothetical protein